MSTKSLRLLTLAAVAASAACLGSASAYTDAVRYTERTLHTFCRLANCADGSQPDGGLVMDQAGNLYGTTVYGGDSAYNCGLVYKLALVSGKWKEYLLHKFGSDGGCNPLGDLIIDKDGNLYGVLYNTSGGYGAIYKLAHGQNGWSIFRIVGFSGSSYGAHPAAGLTYAGQSVGQPWDESSPLFGTTLQGGKYGNGVAYKIDAQGNYSVIHNFQSSAQPNALYEDTAGNLYGTTETGGAYGYGLMFRLASGTWNETLLHSFCSQANCTDGGAPYGRLVMDSSGNLFGTTSRGGSNNFGVVFERNSTGAYTVLDNFCSLANCADGETPEAGLVIDGSGNLFGTTVFGGYGAGVVFELTNQNGTWSESVSYTFCSRTNCADGDLPQTSLIVDGSGDIWGTTTGDGGNHFGNAFKLTPQ